MKLRAVLATAALLTLAACDEDSTAPNPVVLPNVIEACETNTQEVCGTWTLSNGVYNAVWPQGSRATIRVTRFDGAAVVFTREDSPGSSSAGLTAEYSGVVVNDAVQNGTVTWTHNGLRFSGTWRASW